MKSIRKILVPTDFSEGAQEAISYAVEFAKRFEASVTVLHVYQLPVYPFPYGSEAFIDPDAIAKIKDTIDKALEDIKKNIASSGFANVNTASSEGIPSGELVFFAEKNNIDLIVMGTHGWTGIKHIVLGSVAEKVVRHAPCPVLTVRHPDAAAEKK